MKIAFLGLGRMGRVLATHLLEDGQDLTVWNRTASASDELVQHGARPASTAPDAVVGADAVITVLFGPDAVREVVTDAVLPIGAGGLWIDITTVAPADTVEFARWADARQVRYVHSPVVGSLGPARARALGVLLGGPDAAIAEARTIVSSWADPARLRTFDTPGKAATAKLVANLSLAVAMQGLLEALRLGRSGGLSTEEVLTGLDHTVLSGIKDVKGDNVLHERFDDTQFSANLLGKDALLMTHTSRFPLPALAAAFESLEVARRNGHGEDDFAVIASQAAWPVQ
jgi:3-hydroxyisobutyrate dehydrogenase